MADADLSSKMMSTSISSDDGQSSTPSSRCNSATITSGGGGRRAGKPNLPRLDLSQEPGASGIDTGPPLPAASTTASINHAADSGGGGSSGSILPLPVALNGGEISSETEVVLVHPVQKRIKVRVSELRVVRQLGSGQYGVVEWQRHEPSGLDFAVKTVTQSANNKEQTRVLNDLNYSLRSSKCRFVVRSYGALLSGQCVMILMEMMDDNLSKFYQNVHKKTHGKYIAHDHLAFITYCILAALDYLNSISIIHRDVKPSNVLTNRAGHIKVCDFGISGELTGSQAPSNVGSNLYMSPERYDPSLKSEKKEGFRIQSDIWSLGITLLELAECRHPLAGARNFYEQMKWVLSGSPRMNREQTGSYHEDVDKFVAVCLKKEESDRPSDYRQLMRMRFIMSVMRPADSDGECSDEELKEISNGEHFKMRQSNFADYCKDFIAQLDLNSQD